MSSEHLFKVTEEMKNDVQELLDLSDKLPLIAKLYNDKGTSASDLDLAQALDIDLNTAGEVNGTYVALAHYLFSHDLAKEVAEELKGAGLNSDMVDKLVGTYSDLNEKGREAVKFLGLSFGIQHLAPHWEKIWAALDYRPLREREGKERKFEGLIPIVTLKLGVTDLDTEEEKIFTVEMSFLEFRGFMRTLQSVEKNMLKDWEETRKSVGTKVVG